MVKKTTTTTSSSDDSRNQLLSSMKAVELVPVVESSSSSFITVHIANCTMHITDQSDLALLRKISEAFDHD